MSTFRWDDDRRVPRPRPDLLYRGHSCGLNISEDYIRSDLARRQGGYGRGGRQQIETDWARIPLRRAPRLHLWLAHNTTH